MMKKWLMELVLISLVMFPLIVQGMDDGNDQENRGATYFALANELPDALGRLMQVVHSYWENMTMRSMLMEDPLMGQCEIELGNIITSLYGAPIDSLNDESASHVKTLLSRLGNQLQNYDTYLLKILYYDELLKRLKISLSSSNASYEEFLKNVEACVNDGKKDGKYETVQAKIKQQLFDQLEKSTNTEIRKIQNALKFIEKSNEFIVSIRDVFKVVFEIINKIQQLSDEEIQAGILRKKENLKGSEILVLVE